MFKESLRNVTQHAAAAHVTVRLRLRGESLALHVIDDGRGFNSSEGEHASTATMRGDEYQSVAGNGLRNFRMRSKNLGGECRIRSAPGQGTEVEFSVPLNID